MYTEKQSHFFSREFFKIRALRSGFSVFIFWMRPFSLWYSTASMSRFSPFVPLSPLHPYLPFCHLPLIPLCAYAPLCALRALYPYAIMCVIYFYVYRKKGLKKSREFRTRSIRPYMAYMALFLWATTVCKPLPYYNYIIPYIILKVNSKLNF